MAAQGHDQEIASIRRRLVELGEERRALEGKRSLLSTLRSACRAGEGCWLVPGLLVRA